MTVAQKRIASEEWLQRRLAVVFDMYREREEEGGESWGEKSKKGYRCKGGSRFGNKIRSTCYGNTG